MKTLFLFGTRPEAIKMAPVILAMRNDPCFDVKVCVTAQHREMLDQVLQIFNIVPDIDLNLMRPDQSLANLTAKVIESVDKVIKEQLPEIVLIQGDTTTVMASALACFYNKIPVAHIEAGLRTSNKFAPFPEEINRVLATHICDYHFAPTENARKNLLRENIEDSKILTTGNTVVDSLHIVREKIEKKEIKIANKVITELLQQSKRFVLVTIHRRENFGDGIESICKALVKFAETYPDITIVFPVHLNPKIKLPVNDLLSGLNNVYLLEPLDYVSFVAAMSKCFLVVTDSGGVQEEAPAFGKPVLVLRDTTERPESLEAGLSKLVGTNGERIYDALVELIEDENIYKSMSGLKTSPYGDGRASERIIAFLKHKI